MDTLVDAKPTADIPSLSGMRKELVAILLKKSTRYEVLQALPMVCRYLRELPTSPIDLGKTIDALRQAGDPVSIVWQIIHAISTPALGALVLGTIAYKFHLVQVNKFTYNLDGHGIYAVGIAIEGRRGHFLNGKELEKLINLLDRYIRAFEVWFNCHKNPARQRTAEEEELGKFVERIDGPGRERYGPLKFIGNHETCNKMIYLKRSLKARYFKAMALDPLGETPLKQSPQYVGCGRDIDARAKAHRPTNAASSLVNSNKPYSLTMSLITYMDLTPHPVIVTIFRAWEPNQLDCAERLVAALGSAYVTQDGFNSTPAGSHRPAMTSEEIFNGENLVLASSKFLRTNLDESLAEHDKRLQFVEQFNSDSIATLHNGEVDNKLSTLTADSGQTKQDMEALTKSAEIVEKEIELGETRLKQIMAEKRSYQNDSDIYRWIS